MKKVLLIASVWLSCLLPVAAETNKDSLTLAANEKNSSEAKVEAPAEAQSKTAGDTRAEREATIRKIIEATRAREMPNRMIDSLFDRLAAKNDAVSQDVSAALDEALLPADLTPEERVKIQNSRAAKDRLEQTREYINQLEMPRFVAVVFHHLLQEHYTDDELNQLLAFWQSPVGRKTVELMPSMSKDFAELAHQYFPPKLEEVQEQMIRDSQKRGPTRRRTN